ncbi:LysR family transcriptional regulator [Psychromonas ossibalaenae]|uniref:LysR family transcriptional regulator n=1 Tax=Psychromonas ossibalaenae TaxID=444922 RepID=UPI00035DD33F|nr:LysR family transcriptional regulator [Psychromonas ossibalaenae]
MAEMDKKLKMDLLLDLELLRTFVMVVKTGELKKAAEAIFRSQAAVSMQMKRLEELVGCTLMERSNRGIQLTDAGETLLGYSEQFLKLNNAAFSALNERDLSGQFNFGVPTDYAQNFINYFMPVLTREIPNLEAKIVCDRSRNLRERLQAGELDIAIVAGEADYTDELLLWSERLIWSVSPRINLKEQKEVPVAIYDDNCIVSDLCISELKKSNISYRQVFSSSILENVATAVNSGFAISLLPESIFDVCKTQEVPSNILKSNLLLNMHMIHSPMIDEAVLTKIAECLRLASTTQRLGNTSV